ncbi:phosphotransferase [Desulfococcaceae bacterium HSG9]|nr:phosphotransferase [Desulfococcaceae bacterium HSG9]
MNSSLMNALKKNAAEHEAIRHLRLDTEKTLFLEDGSDVADQPADASYKAVFINTDGAPAAFLLASNPKSCDLIARNTAKARLARHKLNNSLGTVILTPIAESRFQGLSWAIFPLKRLPAEKGWAWRYQKLMLTPQLLGWLAGVVGHTKRALTSEDAGQRLCEPLQKLATDRQFSSGIRSAAQKALARYEQGLWKPQTVLVHNDLWKGNILLPLSEERRKKYPEFYIIDWAGSNSVGFPFFDLMKLMHNLGLPGIVMRQVIKKHCRVLNFELEDAMSSLLAAIADLGEHLEYFPRPRYIAMATELIECLASVINYTIVST